jgi:DNA-binding MarR family transcriptional regulator
MRTVQTVTSQAKVSESNRSRILHHLFRNGICSRAQISKALGLTPAAITKITARLLTQASSRKPAISKAR